MSVRLGCRMHGPPTTCLLATHQNQTPAWTTVAAMRRQGEHWNRCLHTPSLQRCRVQKRLLGHSIPFPPHQAPKSQPCITKVNHRCAHIAYPCYIAFAKLGSSCSKQFWPGPSTGLPSMPAAIPWAESRPMLSICAQGLATRVGGNTSGGKGWPRASFPGEHQRAHAHIRSSGSAGKLAIEGHTHLRSCTDMCRRVRCCTCTFCEQPQPHSSRIACIHGRTHGYWHKPWFCAGQPGLSCCFIARLHLPPVAGASRRSVAARDSRVYQPVGSSVVGNAVAGAPAQVRKVAFRNPPSMA